MKIFRLTTSDAIAKHFHVITAKSRRKALAVARRRHIEAAGQPPSSTEPALLHPSQKDWDRNHRPRR